jgi:hypothetical protein
MRAVNAFALAKIGNGEIPRSRKNAPLDLVVHRRGDNADRLRDPALRQGLCDMLCICHAATLFTPGEGVNVIFCYFSARHIHGA